MPNQSKETFLTQVLNTFLSHKMLTCIFTGFASGLPLFLLLQLMPIWLKSEGVNKSEIGLFALAQFPYMLKFLWAPFMDHYSPFRLGRRRGWMLLSQVILFILVILFGFL